MMQVNRTLSDAAMDAIDHALGRPVNPLRESFRNHFVTEASGADAAAFRASPHWREGRTLTRMTCFHVTDAGRAALRDHLRQIGDPYRLFIVTWRGDALAPIAATSHSKARAVAWRRADFGDLSFGDFCRETSVRLAR